jgi:hypothetical protein
MSIKLTKCTQDALDAINLIRHDVLACNAINQRALRSSQKYLVRHSRASAYIWLAASLENYFHTSVGVVLEEINLAHLPANQLRPSLHSILLFSKFDSLKSAKETEKVWQSRLEVVSSSFSNNVTALPCGNPLPTGTTPLDGKTIQPKHLEILWVVFGLPGPCLPTLQHKGALLELREWRNKLAHGEESPAAFEKAKTHNDVIRMIELITQIVEHFFSAAYQYLLDASFSR